jgi:hypothetical protein
VSDLILTQQLDTVHPSAVADTVGDAVALALTDQMVGLSSIQRITIAADAMGDTGDGRTLTAHLTATFSDDTTQTFDIDSDGEWGGSFPLDSNLITLLPVLLEGGPTVISVAPNLYLITAFAKDGCYITDFEVTAEETLPDEDADGVRVYVLATQTDGLVPGQTIGTPTSYCTIAQVRALGFEDEDTYPDQTIVDAIARSTDAIDRYTANFFAPRDLIVRAELGSRGLAPVPMTLQSVTSVEFEATQQAIAVSSYRVHSSTTIGDWNGVQFAIAGFDDTISGAEREYGGFATLFAPGRYVLISGSFGEATVPARVVAQCAILASEDLSGTLDVDSAGIQQEQTPGWRRIWNASADMSRTTGSARVDRALREFRRDVFAAVGV